MSGPLLKEAPVLPPLPENVNETFKILENNPVVKDALKKKSNSPWPTRSP